MTTNFELATQSNTYFTTCKELGLLTADELRSDDLWFGYPQVVLDYMQESDENKLEMIGRIGEQKYRTWIAAFFNQIITRKIGKEFLYPYVNFMEILERAKNANYPDVEDIIGFFFSACKNSNLDVLGPEMAYILDNFQSLSELAEIKSDSIVWSRLTVILLENPKFLLKFAKQCFKQRHIAYLWEHGILEQGEENVANTLMIRALSRNLDLDEFKQALIAWANHCRDMPVNIDYYGHDAIVESLDRFIAHLNAFGQIPAQNEEQKTVATEDELIEYFSKSDKMTFDATFDIFGRFFNKENTLLGLVAQLERLDLSHYGPSQFQDFAHIYIDQAQSLFGETEPKIRALAHMKMRVKFGSNFGSVDHVFRRYAENSVNALATEREILSFLLEHFGGELVEGSNVFVAFRNLFRELENNWEARDAVAFIADQIAKHPQWSHLEAGLLRLFSYLYVRNIQGCIGIRQGKTLNALLDLKLQRADGYNDYAHLVQQFVSYADTVFKQELGKKAKQIHANTPDEALACLRTVVMESQIIAAYCFSEHVAEYPLQWIRRNTLALHNAYETAMQVKGGFDASRYVGYKYAMIYFGSKRAKKNLFKYSKNFDSLVSYENEFGLSSIGYANPFEKGFSWGQYEEFCKHFDVVAFTNSSVSWKKRLVAYFFANMFSEAPNVIERKIKTVLGETAQMKNVVSAVVRQITALDDFNTVDWKFDIDNVRKNKDAIEAYWKQNLSEINQAAFFMLFVGVTGVMPKPGMLKFIFNAIKQFNASQGSGVLLKIAKNSEYCVQAYQNKTEISVILAAIDYANSCEAPNQKEIVLEVQDETSALVGRTLKAGDLRALSIGDEINCCQYVTGHASSCAKATYTESDFGIFVVEAKDKPGSKPLAESAIWLNDSKDVVVIDSIEGQRKDAVSYEKIANVYYKAILQWIAQGKKVVISNTEYGLTVQVRRKIFAKLKNTPKYERSPKMRSMNVSVYSDLGSYAYYVTEQDI